jgi:peptide/nickel transport system permease protein
MPVTGRRTHPFLWYAVRRLAVAVMLLIVLSVCIFSATNVIPGDIATTILGRQATPEQVDKLQLAMGLDKPLPERYASWLGGIARGDLGHSFTYDVPVSDLLIRRMRNTLLFAMVAIVILVPLAIALGAIAALRPGGATDHLLSNVGLLGISVPEFVWATLLALVFGVWLRVVPPTTLSDSPLSDPTSLVLPVATILIAGVPYTSRMARAGFLDVLRSDYFEYAKLSGISQSRAIVKHALPNALAPTVQIIAMTFGWLLGGVVVVETVFNYPGIGNMLVSETLLRDIPFVQTTALLIGTMYLLIYIVADLLTVALVPKLRTTR